MKAHIHKRFQSHFIAEHYEELMKDSTCLPLLVSLRT